MLVMMFYGNYLVMRFDPGDRDIELPPFAITVFDVLAADDLRLDLNLDIGAFISQVLPEPAPTARPSTTTTMGTSTTTTLEGQTLKDGLNHGQTGVGDSDLWAYTAPQAQTIELHLEASESTMMMVRDADGVMIANNLDSRGESSHIRLQLDNGEAIQINVIDSQQVDYTLTLTTPE